MWEQQRWIYIDDKPGLTQLKENNRLIKLDAKAKGHFYNGLDKTEYNKLASRATAHDMWFRLEVAHNRTSQAKKTRLWS